MSSRMIPVADHGPVRGRPGRPPVLSDAERTARLLKAAEVVFTTTGYGAATMEEIARVAGMSKKTVYSLFPDKRHLLTALAFVATDFPWEVRSAEAAAEPRVELRRRLMALVTFVTSPRQIGLTRLLIAEAAHVPGLAGGFYERVIVRAEQFLVEALALVAKADGSPAAGLELDAQILLAAALGDLHLMALFGRTEGLTPDRIAKRVDMTLRRFNLGGPAVAGRRDPIPR